MKFIPLNNLPNVSESRSQSVAPSLAIDGRDYPHVTWIDKKQSYNEVKYTFWDGLQWIYLGDSPNVYRSKQDIIYSPESLLLDSNDDTYIAFSRSSGVSGSIASIANYADGWSLNEIDLSYDVQWIGINECLGTSPFSSSSSSSSSSADSTSSSSSSSVDSSLSSASTSSSTSSDSSSSSGDSTSSSSESIGNFSSSESSSSSLDDAVRFVTIYDNTNSQFKIYGVTSIWTLLGSIDCSISDLSTIRVDSCGSLLGISYVEDSETIKYNFFDINEFQWKFVSFQDMASSQLYGTIIDMDFSGYGVENDGIMVFGWISGTDDYSYINSVMVDSNGVETPSSVTGDNIESNSVDVTSQSYISNGYSKIATILDSSNLVRIITGGSSWKLHVLNSSMAWVSTVFGMEFISNAFVPSYIRLGYKALSNTISASLSNLDDIYYLEQDSEDISISTPSMGILNDKTLVVVDYSDGALSGEVISDISNNEIGSILRESRAKLLITANK